MLGYPWWVYWSHARDCPAPDRRDVLRLLRGARREDAEPARRRRRVGQLRDRRGHGPLRSGERATRRPARRGRVLRLPRLAPGRGVSGRGSEPALARPARRLRRSHRPARGARDGAAAPVPRLGVARARARDAGRVLGRLAVPPRRRAQSPPPRGDDGHADLARHALGVDVVGRRPARRDRRRHVLRSRRRDHDADPARPLPRGPRAPSLGRGDPCAARAGREGGPRAARRRRSARARRRAAPRRQIRRPSRREDRDRRRRRARRVRDRPVDAHRRARPRRGRSRRRGRGRDAQHLRAPRGARDAGGSRDRSRADHPARRRGAGRQGADPAARRPRLGRLRADRDRDLAARRSSPGSPSAAAPRRRSARRSPC